jgi:hydrogenase nickel incorporation protein HypA/HybF
MHELSIVDALIEQVGREVRRAGHCGKVRGIEVNIGRLSGVNCDSVRFAFELLAPGTLVEEAKILINQTKAACRCHACNARVEIDDLVFKCPQCASDAITIEGGRDLILQNIEVDDAERVESGE